jgi:hypothetical protein
MNSTLILLVGAGALLYYFFESQSSLPSDAVAVSSAALASGATVSIGTQTLTGPGYVYFAKSTGQYYVNSQAPTAAQISAGAALFGGAATSTPTPTQGSTATPVGPAPVVAAATPSVLGALWSQVQSAAAKDANYIANNGQMTGSQWNYYISYVSPNAPSGFTGPVWPPEVPNTSGLMTASAYWALLQPEMVAQGLSGFQGMGALNMFSVRGPGGWRA